MRATKVYTKPLFLEDLTTDSVEQCTETVKFICQTGGAFVTYLSKEQISVSANAPGLDKKQKASILSMEPGHWINIYEDFFVNHTKEERAAVFFHEMGHVRFGHVPVAVGVSKPLILNVVEYELCADHYSTTKVSKKAMHDGLIRSVSQAVTIMGRVKGLLGEAFDFDSKIDQIMSHESTVVRLKALSN